ncbi:MAG: HD domain-containing protein [Dehalococcoidia bacterium]
MEEQYALPSLAPAVRRLLLKLLKACRQANVDAYLVGGFLRGLLLGGTAEDVDIAVSGDASALVHDAAEALKGRAFPLDEERGVFRVALPAGAPVRYVDVTRLRGDIDNDLRERDFTIDAMALPLAALAGRTPPPLLDPLAGRADLARRSVRAVDDGVFRADGLRLLRAVRLCAELDFSLDDASAALVRRDAPLLDGVSPERKRDEFVRILATTRAAASLAQLDALGLLERLLPEVAACRGVSQPKEHHWDVFRHSIETVAALDFMLADAAPSDRRRAAMWHELWGQLAWLPDLRAHFYEETVEGRTRAALLKLAGLLHDVAKPETKAPDRTGRIRFFGHAELGAEKAAAVLRRLRFSGAETRLVALIIEDHLRPGQLSGGGPPTRRAIYRFFRDTGDAAVDILFLTLADALAARGPRLRVATWRRHVAYVSYVLARHYLDRPPAVPPRLLTGDDLMAELAVEPGPLVGRLLAAVEEARGAGEITTGEEALALARSLRSELARSSRRRSQKDAD